MGEPTRLEEIEQRLTAMPDGPYVALPSDRFISAVVKSGDGRLLAICGGRNVKLDEDADAEFFAHSWADLRDLLAVARAVRRFLELDAAGAGHQEKLAAYIVMKRADAALEKPADG